MMQLILAVDLMHRNGIIHRDFKPENILLLDNEASHVCISDLGLASSTLDYDELQVRCGTPGFIAPEVLAGCMFTTQADIFSLGCFMFFVITGGGQVYNGRNMREIMAANRFLNPQERVSCKVRNVSKDCKDLLRWMLEVNPSKRPSAEQCLGHQWFKEDQQAVQSSIYINKHQGMLSSILCHQVKGSEVSEGESDSGSNAPNPNS